MSGAARDDCGALGGPAIAVAEALARLRDGAVALVGVETVPLERACGRILAAPLVSPRDVPGFDNAAVDGWAVDGAALAPDAPTRLTVAPGRAAAGHPYPGPVPAGHAVRALTGAPMPEGTDTVVMQEEAVLDAGTISVPAGLRRGANRRRAGEDVRAGQQALPAGILLLPQHLGVAAELGLAELPVHARLRVALLSSGDELVEPGVPLGPGRLHDANRPILKALLGRLPVEVSDLGIVRDDAADVAATLERAAKGHHLLIASGGASRGTEDHVVRTVAERGRLAFWRIAMKPGRPLAIGALGRSRFVGLPGNPVAAMVCFLRFARPLLLVLAGASWPAPVAFPVAAGFALSKTPGRTEMLRGRLRRDAGGRLRVERIRREGSGILTSLTDADGLIEIGAEVTAVAPGDPVPFYPWSEFGAG